ncbi:MAG: Fe-S protein assembly co-chaperone HscB [Pseudomonadota bacterium]|nr:MAG: Fe-S protein assembly co-chaperone HscB [Pseudomonadota bacterium]
MLGPASHKNYFELFELPIGFAIDTMVLGARYRELARRVHPDRFAHASDQERRLAMQWTTLLNEAFQTLQDPIRRGQYLLSLSGVATLDDTDTQMDPDFLMEQMELREQLEAARSDTAWRERLAALSAETRQRMQSKTQEFQQALEQGEPGRARATNAIREMQFLAKMEREIGELEEELE